MGGLRQIAKSRACIPLANPLTAGPIEGAGPLVMSLPDPDAGLAAQLERTIEAEIIPRLMLAHKAAAGCPSRLVNGERNPTTEDVAELARIVLAHDASVAVAYLDIIRSQGVSLETLFLDLLAPAARFLGDLWKEDLCDFMDVTVGLSRLQQVLREYSPAFECEADLVETRQCMLLIPANGEQHTFGIFMVEEFFRRAGWDVRGGSQTLTADIRCIVEREWISVAGFSLSCETRLASLASDIRDVRKSSRNRGIGVLVGGRVFVENPDLVLDVGADATAVDARQAVVQAHRLLGLAKVRC